MRKADVLDHFGTQQRVADALTAAGFPISQRGVSGWPDLVPLDRATQLEHITARSEKPLKTDLALYQQKRPEAPAVEVSGPAP